jgi:hypothetical protein
MFKQLLLKKKILVINEILNICCNKFFLSCDLFFETNKVKNYKKRKKLLNLDNKIINVNQKNYYSNIILKLTKKINIKFNTNYIVGNFKILNKLNFKFLSFLYKKLKLYVNSIFSRRIGLFIDFLKITTLYYYNKVDLFTFGYILTQIFKYLEKKKHSKFISFIRKVFNILVFESKKMKDRFFGVKLIIKGRIKGKPMASISCIQIGKISIQSISKSIDFAKVHTFTPKFGVFGFKIWVQNSI